MEAGIIGGIFFLRWRSRGQSGGPDTRMPGFRPWSNGVTVALTPTSTGHLAASDAIFPASYFIVSMPVGGSQSRGAKHPTPRAAHVGPSEQVLAQALGPSERQTFSSQVEGTGGGFRWDWGGHGKEHWPSAGADRCESLATSEKLGRTPVHDRRCRYHWVLTTARETGSGSHGDVRLRLGEAA